MNVSFKQRRARVGALTLVLAGLFAFAMIRLVVLVAFDGARLNSLARNEHSGETKLAAVRGPIVDRNGEPLALSAETRSVYARPHRALEISTPSTVGTTLDGRRVGFTRALIVRSVRYIGPSRCAHADCAKSPTTTA